MNTLENLLKLMNSDKIHGLRERKKVEKLHRILTAARELFTERGYDETTTREISERAGIATGTLFSYFKDKRALLTQLFALDIDAAVDEAFETLPTGSIIERVMHLFEACYRYYDRDLRLSRSVIKEMMFLDPEPRRVLEKSTSGFIVRIGAEVEAARSRGEVRSDAAGPLVATAFFAQYYFALIAWVNGIMPNLPTAVMVLRQSLELIHDGLKQPDSPTEVSQ